MGSGDRIRTCDTGLMSPLLYRLSYAAICGFVEPLWKVHYCGLSLLLYGYIIA